jgi:signal recognition particle GTPase
LISPSRHLQAFKKSVNVGAIIITKMDSHAKGGGAISACVVLSLSLSAAPAALYSERLVDL